MTVDQNGKLTCSLVKLAPVEKPAQPSQQPDDPQQWYETHGRQALETLVSDLDSRGHSGLTLKEDGSICIAPKGNGEEVKQGVLADFPAKGLWPKLADILEQEGLAAAVWDDCIAVTW